MAEENSSQSISISGSQVSGRVALAGRDVIQTEHNSQGEAEKQLTSTDVVELIAKIETLFRNSDLPEDQKEKAIKHLDTAKDEVQAKEPDKDYAAKSFQRATKILKDADEAVGVGQGLWKKLEPIATQLAPWLGVAAKTLLFM